MYGRRVGRTICIFLLRCMYGHRVCRTIYMSGVCTVVELAELYVHFYYSVCLAIEFAEPFTCLVYVQQC